MANTSSAEKRNRQRQKRRSRNIAQLSKVRTHIKRVRTALDDKSEHIGTTLKEAVRVLDKAAQKGVLKRKTASRRIARLTKQARASATPG
ncbi:MAG: 30S ribosomal protein S20 [Pseudomonadota bacterium]